MWCIHVEVLHYYFKGKTHVKCTIYLITILDHQIAKTEATRQAGKDIYFRQDRNVN